MKAICLECEDDCTLDSFSDILTGIKVSLHLRRHHPSLWKKSQTLGMDSVTTIITLEDGTPVELIAENIEYTDDDGQRHIEIFPQTN